MNRIFHVKPHYQDYEVKHHSEREREREREETEIGEWWSPWQRAEDVKKNGCANGCLVLSAYVSIYTLHNLENDVLRRQFDISNKYELYQLFLY